MFLCSELMNLGVESMGDLRWCHDVGKNIYATISGKEKYSQKNKYRVLVTLGSRALDS